MPFLNPVVYILPGFLFFQILQYFSCIISFNGKFYMLQKYFIKNLQLIQ